MASSETASLGPFSQSTPKTETLAAPPIRGRRWSANLEGASWTDWLVYAAGAVVVFFILKWGYEAYTRRQHMARMRQAMMQGDAEMYPYYASLGDNTYTYSYPLS